MKLKLCLLGTVAALSVVAASQSEARNHGWYVGIEGGANWADDNDGLFGINSSVPFFTETTTFDTGWAVLATVGYAFDNNWRIELEGGYRENDIDLITIPAFFPNSGGDLSQITLMANVLYDIPLTERLGLTVGVGAGVNHAEFEPPAFWGGGCDTTGASSS